MSSSLECFTLYPHGTLGRLFIDIAIESILAIKPLSIIYNFNTMCINNSKLLLDAIKTITSQAPREGKNFFPLTANDARSLGKNIINFDKNNPVTIIDYVTTLIDKGGYSRLRESSTAPLVMRIEFYEYAKEGYAQYKKSSTYPYKKASVLDLGLATLGSLITHIAMIILEDRRYFYFIPLTKPINLQTIYDLKNVIRSTINIYAKQSKTLGIVTTYKISSYMSRSISTDTTLGELLVIKVIGNRYSIVNRELVNTNGWIWLINKLSGGARKIDLVVDIVENTLRKTNYESLSPMYEIIDELFRYIQCDESALYRAVRAVNIAIDAFRKIEEGAKLSEDWMIIYQYLINRGIKNPAVLFSSLVEDLGSLAESTPCQEER